MSHQLNSIQDYINIYTFYHYLLFMKDAWFGGVFITTEKLPKDKYKKLKELADEVIVERKPDYVIIGKFYNIRRFTNFVQRGLKEVFSVIGVKPTLFRSDVIIRSLTNNLSGEISAEIHKYYITTPLSEIPKDLLKDMILHPDKYVGRKINVNPIVIEKVDKQRISLDAVRLMLEELFKKKGIMKLSMKEFNEILKKEINKNIDISSRMKGDYAKYYEGPYLLIQAFCQESDILYGITVCRINKIKVKENGRWTTYITFESYLPKEKFMERFLDWLMKKQKYEYKK